MKKTIAARPHSPTHLLPASLKLPERTSRVELARKKNRSWWLCRPQHSIRKRRQTPGSIRLNKIFRRFIIRGDATNIPVLQAEHDVTLKTQYSHSTFVKMPKMVPKRRSSHSSPKLFYGGLPRGACPTPRCFTNAWSWNPHHDFKRH